MLQSVSINPHTAFFPQHPTLPPHSHVVHPIYVAKSDQNNSTHQRWILIWANSESKTQAKMPIIRKKPGMPRKVSEII